MPGQRLPDPARLAGLRGALRHPRRVRLPDRTARKQWEVHDRRTASRRRCCSSPAVSMYLPTGTPHAARAQDDRLAARHHRHQPAHLARPGRARRAPGAAPAADDEHLPAGYLDDPARLADGPGRPPRGARRRAARPRPGAAVADAEVRRFLTGRTPASAAASPTCSRVRERRRHHPAAPPARPPVRAARPTGDRLEVLLGDRALHVPARLRPALEVVAPGPATRPADLADHLDAQSRLVLCRRLVREGLLGSRADRSAGDPLPLRRREPGRATSRSAGTASTVRAFLLARERRAVGRRRAARRPAARRGQARLRAPVGRSPACASCWSGGPGRRPPARGRRGLRVFAAYADPDRPVAGDGHPVRDRERGPRPRPRGARPAGGRRASPAQRRSRCCCVCTHGRHDACCAERGRPVAAALAAAHPEQTWEVSHIGGDRFAANVLVLPDGLYYGRVSAADAPRWPPPTSPADSTWTTCAAGPASAAGAGRRGRAAPRGGRDPHATPYAWSRRSATGPTPPCG